MAVHFICPDCYQEITAEDNMAGEEATCPTCEAALRIPASGEETPVSLGGYELEQCLGEGRMGLVYRARQSSMNRVCALKILAPDLTENEQYVRRFVEEIRLIAQIEHPHVVKFYDVGEVDGRVYAAMSYIEGTDLATQLEEAGPLDEAEALRIALTTAKTLDHVWKQHQVLAQNLNPSNIYLDRHNQVKLLNLGVTRHEGNAPDAAASLNKPTIAYMSPEHTTGKAQDVRSDIYSLGVTIYQLVTGELPYGDSNVAVPVRQRRETLSEHLEQLLQVMLEHNPEHRHQDWQELQNDIERVQAGTQPYRMPGGNVLSEENLREEARARLQLRRNKDVKSDDEDEAPAIISTAAAAEAESRAARHGDTPTMAEVRDTAEPEDAGDGKRKLRLALRIVVLLVALGLGYKYGFGPLLSAWRGHEAKIYVLNDSPDQRYMLRLGWRMMRRELHPGAVVSFPINVGMKETQGLVVWTIDEDGNRKKLKKLKIPLDPTAQVLVNLNQKQTYYIYEPQRITGESLAGLEQLGQEILQKENQLTAPKTILDSAAVIGRKAIVGETNAEVIDLRKYRQRAGRVGQMTDEAENDELPILTDNALAMGVAGGNQITIHGGEPDQITVVATLPVTGKVEVWNDTVLDLKNPRPTITLKDETMSVSLNGGAREMQQQNIKFRSNWQYTASRQPKQAWTWRWTFTGTNQHGQTAATHRLTIVAPNTGTPEAKVDDLRK